MRLINQAPLQDSQMTEHSIHNAKKLIFVRHLGHKRDLKGIGQWKL
jgi:hypothetical protein